MKKYRQYNGASKEKRTAVHVVYCPSVTQCRLCTAKRRECAFTVIEMVGVIAIVTILVTIVAENVLAKMKRQMRETEASNLATFADAMRKSIIRTKSIPGVGALPAQIASELQLPNSKVMMTANRYARYFFIHPGIRLGTNVSSTIPYTQTVMGSTVLPTNCQALIISSLGPIGDDVIPAEMDTATFVNLWNAGEEWDVLANDVRIQHVQMQDLFHRVILNNRDPIHLAPYSIETTNNLAHIDQGNSYEAWFLDKTVLNLHFANGILQARDIISQDVSYVFEKGCWYRYAQGNQGSGLLGDFGALVDRFLEAQTYYNNKFGADQQSIVDDMYNYLWFLALWASDGFDDGGCKPLPQVPEFRVTSDAAVRLGDFAKNLVD